MTTRPKSPRLAAGLALAGLATAIVSMALLWNRLSQSDAPGGAHLWPLPALYLVEAVALPALVLAAVVGGWRFVAWPALGALATIGLLGAMTIGVNVALALVFLAPASILGDNGSTAARKAGGALLGGFLQGGLMFAVIQYALRHSRFGAYGG